MFDIVPAHDHELAMTVQIIGVDHAETRLTRPPAAAPQATSKQQPVEQHQNKGDKQNSCGAENPKENFVVADHVGHKLPSRLDCARAKWLTCLSVHVNTKVASWAPGVKQWLISTSDSPRCGAFAVSASLVA
jgi:hypothetical protein